MILMIPSDGKQNNVFSTSALLSIAILSGFQVANIGLYITLSLVFGFVSRSVFCFVVLFSNNLSDQF